MDPVKTVRKVTGQGNSKQIAEACDVSLSLVNKWGEAGEQHRTNPLEAFLTFYHATGDRRLLDCACREADGYFVPNPPADPPPDTDILRQAIDRWQREKLRVEAVLVKMALTGEPTPALTKRLRKRVERFKSVQEGLLQAIEQGRFRRKLPAWLLTLWPTLEWLGTTGGGCS